MFGGEQRSGGGPPKEKWKRLKMCLIFFFISAPTPPFLLR